MQFGNLVELPFIACFRLAEKTLLRKSRIEQGEGILAIMLSQEASK